MSEPTDNTKALEHLRNCAAFAAGKGATDFVLVAINRDTGWMKTDEASSPATAYALVGALEEAKLHQLAKARKPVTEWDETPRPTVAPAPSKKRRR